MPFKNSKHILAEDFGELVAYLKNRLEKELPGEKAQYKLAPEYRGKTNFSTLTGHRTGSVMVLLFELKNLPHVLFIERADDGKVHAGQIAFPGGKTDETDVSYAHTAMRETEEEIGILQSNIETLGGLTPLYIPPSNFLVNPFVGILTNEPDFIISKEEVKRTIAIPLAHFFEPGVIRLNETHSTYRGEVKAPAFVLQNVKIWGATSMILSEFLDLFAEEG